MVGWVYQFFHSEENGVGQNLVNVVDFIQKYSDLNRPKNIYNFIYSQNTPLRDYKMVYTRKAGNLQPNHSIQSRVPPGIEFIVKQV